MSANIPPPPGHGAPDLKVKPAALTFVRRNAGASPLTILASLIDNEAFTPEKAMSIADVLAEIKAGFTEAAVKRAVLTLVAVGFAVVPVIADEVVSLYLADDATVRKASKALTAAGATGILDSWNDQAIFAWGMKNDPATYPDNDVDTAISDLADVFAAL